MKQKLENVMRNKKVMIALMEILIVIGCIVVFYLMMSSNNRAKETTYSYSKVEEVKKYRVVDNYITRVEPLTSYETFKEIAENTLNNASEDVQYTVKVYSDAEKTEEVTSGYIASGMVVEAIEKIEEVPQEEIENQETEQENGELPATDEPTEGNEIESVVETETTEESEELPEEITGTIYTVSVLGDMTQDGDISIGELTKLIKGVVGLTDWRFTEEEELSADISGDNEINVVDIELCINYIVFGKLDFEEATFTVIFKDYDGREISKKKDYHYGDTIEIPEEPTREADEIYTYEFAGWAPVISEKVTKDEVYVATYKAIEIATEGLYKVEHYKENKDGEYELAETEELVGKIGEEVTVTAKEYTGYRENVESEDRIVSGTVLEDGSLVLKLYYDRNTYTVIFKDEDGTEISTKTYKYEDTVEVPENPSKAEDNTYTYEFSGWTPEVSETVTENVEYTATYEGIYKEYIVVFKDENGTILNTRTYHYGDTIEIPENPSKSEDNIYTYEFSGWTPEVAETVKGNAEYTATYTSVYKEYTVIFKNDDGSVITSGNYHYGDTVEIPENPTKAADETYLYEFAGWTPAVKDVVTENAEYTATYKIIYREYTVEFKNDDGSLITSKVYHYGDTVEVPGNPNKAEDNTYTYEFAGWTPEVKEIVTENVEYIATYTNIYKEYTIVFKDDDETELSKKIYHYGDRVEIPENPTKVADETYTYEFAGWTPEVEETVKGNAEYTAIYTNTNIEYTIVFKNYDGTELSKKIYHYGDGVEIPENPTKPEDDTYTYEFDGWTPEVEETVKGDAEYTATFRSIYKEYTVEFKNEDESVITSKIYHYGDTIEVPENPTKPADEIYTYEFAGWTPEVEETVKGNAEYTATYANTNIEYTIVFKNYDGTELSRKTYHYGDIVEVPENPSRPEDETYTYEFSGWTPEVSEAVVGNAEYTATFRNIYKEYTVVFKNYDGTEVSSKDYHYGDIVEIPGNPTKAEDETYTYEFAGWTPEVSEEVVGNAEYIATYEGIYKEYTVVFKNDDGTELSTKTYHYGDTTEVPENPTKAEDETYIYEFAGWTPEVSETVVGNAEYTATYEGTYKEYTIEFKNYDGTVVSTKTYHYGDTIEIPENPSKPEDETYTYEFAGWDKEITSVEEDRTYVATYTAIYKEYVVTFKQDNGMIINSTVYHYGDTIELPEDPIKESTIEYAYTFTGWTPEVEETVTENVEYSATYQETKINYTLIFYNDDETTEIARIENYNYGDSVTFPSTPSKEPTEEINYKFDAWKTVETEKISESQINIKFVAQYTEEYFVARVLETETSEGVSYMSLQEAIYSTGEEKRTIKLLLDTEESVLVDDVQDITLDLNGKTITGSKTGTKAYAIKNYGTLEITDTTETKSGKIQESARETVGYGIYNREGQLTIQSGMIVTDTDRELGSTYAIYNQSEESVLINGGTISAEAKGESSLSYGIYNLSGKEIIVSGGTILGNASAEKAKGYGIYNATDGTISVTGGTIKGTTSLASAESYGIYNIISEDVIISGGNIEVKSDNGYAYGVYNEQGKVTQTAGNVNVVASNGKGFYNKKGIIDIKGGTIELNGSNMIGVYNEITGTINVSGGEIILMASSSYGIYNQGIMNVTGGSILSKTEDTGYGIYNWSTIDSNISNISISKTEYGIYNSKGNLIVKDIDITAKYGIRTLSNNYTTILESGDIVAKQYGIYCEYGTIELGKKDGEINTIQPNIYGELNAVYNGVTSTAAIKYYDGILVGTTAIYGGLSEIEDNAKIISTINENNKEVIELEKLVEEKSVAKIGDTTYSTLADAVNVASTSDEEESTEIAKLASIAGVKLGETETIEDQILIEIIADFTMVNAVEIPEGMNIKIDLAGHKIKTYAKGGIINNGTLEIVDTSVDSSAELISRIGIAITNRGRFIGGGGSITSNAYGIYNTGNIVVNSGSIYGNTYGIYNYRSSNYKTIINKGTVTGTEYGVYNDNTSNYITTVNGGVVTGKYGIREYNTWKSTINLNGGIITGTSYGIYENGNIDNSDNVIINVTNGTIIGNSYGIDSRAATVNISGGTIIGKNYDGISGSYTNVNMTAGKVVSMSNYSSYSGIRTSREIKIEGGEVEGYNGISGSTVVIGKKDNNLDINNPIIIGKKYGVSATVLKIYDGRILGKTDSISGSIIELEEGRRIEIGETTFNDETYKIANWIDNEIYENAIVKVGNNEYTSWKEAKTAINSIATNSSEPTEIKILNDFYMTEELEIQNGQNVILDLNGKTITTMSRILNKGTLNLTDNTVEGQGMISNTIGIGIQNSGNMTMTKGNIKAESYGIYNSSGNIVIIGGNIESSSYGVYNYSGYTIIGTEDGNVINTPVIKGESTGVYKNTGTISMFDGTLIGKNSSSADKTEEDYKLYSYQEDGYYKTIVVELSPMAKIGDVETSLIEAIELAQEEDTIEILRDIQVKEKVVVPEDKNLTIDLKGYTISMKANATNVDAILENKGTLNLVGNNGLIKNNTSIGTTLINNGIISVNAYIDRQNSRGEVINNGTFDLLGGYIYSDYGIVVQNNGTFNLKGGSIGIDNSSSSFAVNNKGEFNLLGGTIKTYYSGSGIKNELGSIFTMKSGSISVDGYAIYNDSDDEINILGGSISRSYKNMSISYAIYNNNSADINIEGLSISSGYRYGIYNNLDGNIKISNKTNIYAGDGIYGYGIYNNGTGDIEISGKSTIGASNAKFSYGVYHNGSGNLTIEKTTISVKGTNQAYGIVNAGQGNVEIKNVNINVNSDSGYAYGIQNGVLGTTNIERANIIVNTIDGKSYGINNESKNPLTIKEGLLAATGTQSTGIYSSASNVVLGNNDESITSEIPVIQSDNIGIYINEVDAKFSFYDGRIIAEIPFNTGATAVEGYKIIQYYDRAEGKEVAIPVEEDNYVLTYSLMNGEKYDAFIIKAGTEITNDLMPNIEEGYEFTGWTGLPEVMPEEDVTVYAVLLPKTYTITYFVDGEEYYKQENVEYNSEILPIDVPVKEGHEFSGWEGLQEVMPAKDLEIKGVFTYIAIFYNEDKTQIISQVPFTINDTSIEEPEIEEKEGYTRYWPEYELVAENIDIQLVAVENKAVINKKQGKSYDNLKTAIDEAKTDGTKDEIYLLEDINIESTIITAENTNIDIDLNGHKIINNTTYCGIENNGTLLIKNTAEEVSSIEVSKEGTNVYGIYNKNSVVLDNVEVKVESGEGYEGTGIYNEENATATLGIKDENASQTMPKVTATTYAISNETGKFNFYDGYLIANSAINGETTETEIGHEKKVDIIENKENCYLQQVPNGTKLQATDENGITWNFTVSNKRAIGLYYESGELPENLVIPSILMGCPVTSFRYSSDQNIFAKDKNNSNTTIKKITIPDTVEAVTYDAFYNCTGLIDLEIGNNVTRIESDAFNGCSSLMNVQLGNKVQTIGSSAFSGCSSLMNINIPDSVTTIGESAFNNATRLTNIVLGNNVKSVGNYAFSNCKSLTSIKMPDSVTTIGYNAFENCKGLSNIEIGKNITSLGSNVFRGCDSLTKIDVHKDNTKYSSKDGVLFDKYKLTIIRYPLGKNDITSYSIPKTVNTISECAFHNCTSLTNIEIPNSVMSIGDSAFVGCTSLTSVVIPKGVTSIGSSAFSGCTALTSIEISKGVSKIESNTFYNCISLKSIVIPENVTSIGSYAFYGCTSLTSIEISDGVSKIENNAFYECKSLESIVIPESVTSIGSYAFDNCIALTSVVIPEGVTSIKYGTFRYCTSLINVEIPNSITSIEDYAFYNCTSLINVEIPNSVKTIEDNVFYNCTSLINVEIPNSVTTIQGYAFSYCSSLTSIGIPSSVTNMKITALSGCDKLERIEVDENNTIYSSEDGVLFNKEQTELIKYPINKIDVENYQVPSTVTTIAGSAFEYSKGVKYITMPNSVTTIGNYAFSNCLALENVTIPDSVTSLGYYTFQHCYNLKKAIIGNGVTAIRSMTFYYCSNLENVTIGNSVTAIENNALYKCTLLTNVEIPDSVTSIGSSAFEYCTNLKVVTIGNGITNIGNKAFYENDYITDIFIGAEQANITFGNNWRETGKVHYGNCSHNLTNSIQSDTLSVVELDESDKIQDGKITCRGTYKFKLVNESGETVKDKLVKVTDSRTIWIAPDQDGVYTIENIIVDTSIKEIGELSYGKVVQAIDLAGITWNYTYQDGEAQNLYYEKGTLTSNIQIPNELNGHTVVSYREEIFKKAGIDRNVINTITIPSSVNSINTNAFTGCNKLESIEVDGNNYYYSSFSGILYDRYKTKIVHVPKSIKEAIIPEGISNIEQYTFSYCKALESVTILEGVQSIGYQTFYDCTSLTNVEIPESVISIGSNAFYNCTSLISIKIPNNVTNIESSTFSNCSNLTNITIGDKVANINVNAFDNCTKLESINVSEDNENYSSIDGMLYNKEQTEIIYIPRAIKNVTISDKIENVKYDILKNCTNIETITIGAKVNHIESNVFDSCTMLTDINVSDKNDTYSSINGILCDKEQTTLLIVPRGLTEVEVPDTVTKIENRAFYKCGNLETITIGDNVSEIVVDDIAFYNCSKLKRIDVSEGNNTYSSINGVLYNKEQSKLIKVPHLTGEVLMPINIETIGSYAFNNFTKNNIIIRDGVKTIESYAFNNCTGLESITIPNSVTAIESFAFNNCSNLTTVIMGTGVTHIESNVFNNCNKLTRINVSEDNTSYCSVNGILYNKDQTTIIRVPASMSEVVIPETVTSIGDYAFYNRTSLKNVIIPEGVTNIGSYAFYNCDGLTNITIPETVTNIGEYAFYDCDYLTSITIPDNVVHIGDYTFYDCGNLKEVTLGSGVTKVGNYLFYYCRNLTIVTMSNETTSIGNYAFYRCSNLTNITIPESVTNIGEYAFYECSQLTSLTIPQGVTAIENYTFYNCSKITNMTIPEGVTKVGNYAFYNCYNLTNTTIPDSVEEIGEYAFYNCDKLESVVIPDTMTSIGKGTFSNCSALTSVTIPKSVVNIGESAFCYCSNLTNVNMSESLTNIGELAFYDCNKLTSIIIPDKVISIGNYAFYSCDVLKNVILGNDVEKIGNDAFGYCKVLTEITIPNSVTSIGSSAFSNCESLKEITISNGVTKIESNMFNECKNLTKVKMSNNVTSIGGRAFYNCSNLKDMEIPDKVTTIGGYAFYNCYNVTSLLIPEGVKTIGSYAFYNCYNLMNTTIPESVIEISGECAFYNCDKLENVIIPEAMTSIGQSTFYSCNSLKTVTIGKSITNIGNYAFYDCNKLESINVDPENPVYSSKDGVLYNKEQTRIILVPKAVKEVEIAEGVMKIENSAFYNCAAITSIIIPEGVISIGNSAFYNCNALINVTIPDNVTSIGNEVFYSCDSLKSVTIGKGVTDIEKSAFDSCNNLENINVSEENLTYSSKDGVLYNKEETIIILVPKAVKEVEIAEGVTNIEDETFIRCNSLSTVVIPDSVISVGNKAFYDCNSLTNVAIPDSVVSIGNYAFYSCDSLTSITIGKELSSIGENALANCNKLESINVSEENVTYSSINGVFYNKEQGKIILVLKTVTEVEIIEGITGIGTEAFKDCATLITVVIPDSVTTIGNKAFYNCTGLTSVTIGEGVTSIGDETFSGCSRLTTVVIPDTVTSIGNKAFYNCTGLTSVTIGESVTTIGDEAFSGCSNLTTVVIPDSVTTMGNKAFNSCTALTSVTIGKEVTSIGKSAFDNCNSLESINVSEENTTYSSKGVILYNKERTTIILVPKAVKEAEIAEGVTTIDAEAFSGCSRLTTVVIPDSVTSIGNKAFYNCLALKNVIIGKGVTNIGESAFSNCNSLESINVSEENTTYSSKGVILYNKERTMIILVPKAVKEVEIAEGVTTIDAEAFSGCSRLTTVVIPDSVTSIGNKAFYNCSALKNVTIGKGVTNIGESAFSNCNNLEAINVSEENTTYSSINGVLYNKDQTMLLLIPLKMTGEIILSESITSIESEHNYSNSISKTYVKTIKGATSLKLIFDERCQLESNYDYIQIYDGQGNTIYNSKGNGNTALAGKTVIVEGDTVKIKFYTDQSVTYWGFKCVIEENNL